MEFSGRRQESVRGTVRADWPACRSQRDQLCGTDFRRLFRQQWRILYQPYAVRSGAGRRCTQVVRPPVQAGSTGEWPDLLLYLPAGWRGTDLPDPERDDGLHAGDHRLGDPVHVCLDHHPVFVPGLSQEASGAAPEIDLQDAGRQTDVLGVYGILRVCVGAVDAAR
ncbi:hypothetical protein D3C72_1827470 [compost metagenome]